MFLSEWFVAISSLIIPKTDPVHNVVEISSPFGTFELVTASRKTSQVMDSSIIQTILGFLGDNMKMPQLTNLYNIWYLPILLALMYVFWQRILSPLSSIPGPLGASLSRFWLVQRTRKGMLHRQLLGLHEKYGSLVRIAPNEVSVTDLDAIRKIYGGL